MEVSKKSSKDELLDVIKKLQKMLREGNTERRNLDDENMEFQSRVESLTMQVELYKEKDRESTQKAQAPSEEKQLKDAQFASLVAKVESDAEIIKQLEQQLKTLTRENETLKEAASASVMSPHSADDLIDFERSDTQQLMEAIQTRDRKLRESNTQIEEFQTRIHNLMKSHEAYTEQSIRDTETEIEHRLASTQAEFRSQRERWEAERTAMIDSHLSAHAELKTKYDELKSGVEKSQAWSSKDKEVKKVKAELTAMSEAYDVQAERITELLKTEDQITAKDILIAQLRDQIIDVESDLLDTRTLCAQAISQQHSQKPPDPNRHRVDPSGPIVSISSAASSSSTHTTTPPPSPGGAPKDLFDLALTGRNKSKRQMDMQKQISMLKNKIRADENARQKSMDEIETYRADYVNSLLSELETLRKEGNPTSEGPSADVVRLRGEFQREREDWEMERQELLGKIETATTASAVTMNDTSLRDAAELQPEMSAMKDLLESKELQNLDLEAFRERATAELTEKDKIISTLRRDLKVKELHFETEIEKMKVVIKLSEDRSKELQGRFMEMESQVSTSLVNGKKLREAEERITHLQAEVAVLQRSPIADASSNPSISGDFRLNNSFCAERDGIQSISPIPAFDPSPIILPEERKKRIEELRQQYRSIQRK